MMEAFKGKKILVTGGTGSIGFKIVQKLLASDPKVIRVFSRDDTKHFNSRIRLNNDPRVSFLLGDVRDKQRLYMAMEGIDMVFHAAALKHVQAIEHDPYEAVKTNVLGTQNVIECALARGVQKVVGISSDKAADPTSVLGCTKLLSEKLMQAAFHYKGSKQTQFCFVRFGNVVGSRGSVIPLFCRQIKQGEPMTLTDPAMSRFFMSIGNAVDLVLKASQLTRDREVFILKMPVIRIQDLAEAVRDWYAPLCGRDPASVAITTIGKQHGERLHEILVGRDECVNALETPDMVILKPFISSWDVETTEADYPNARRVAAKEFSTASPEFQSRRMTKQQIIALLNATREDIESAIF